MEISRTGGSKSFEVVGRGATIVGRILSIIIYAVAIPAWERILFWRKNLRKTDYFKLAVIFIVLIFSLFQGIYVLDFFVLLFGLVSVLFGLDMRISAGCALVLLAACPILLAFHGNVFAGGAAIYAYYFLVTAVFTGIGDQIRETAVPELSTGQ